MILLQRIFLIKSSEDKLFSYIFFYSLKISLMKMNFFSLLYFRECFHFVFCINNALFYFPHFLRLFFSTGLFFVIVNTHLHINFS